MFKIQTLNNISTIGLEKFPEESYVVATDVQDPDAILLRSFDMHKTAIPPELKAVGRAGAGVNNIPVDKLTPMGIPVFNAPGANANAVKELVLAGMLLASRNICQGWNFARSIEGDDNAFHEQVEKGKKQFVGYELAGHTVGVIGLGAIGVKVANAALALDMNVIAYDPAISVKRAWELSSLVQEATSVDEVLKQSDFITLHVPLNEHTRNLINPSRIADIKVGAVLLNFSRDGIVDEDALCKVLDAGKLHAYVTDFPNSQLLKHARAIPLPHLGASTREAEVNCAVMVVKQLRDYLENGVIRNSVNFPDAIMPRTEGHRIAIVNSNIPNMVGQISSCLGEVGLNIIDLLNKSRGDIAYTLIDVNDKVERTTIDALNEIDGVINARIL